MIFLCSCFMFIGWGNPTKFLLALILLERIYFSLSSYDRAESSNFSMVKSCLFPGWMLWNFSIKGLYTFAHCFKANKLGIKIPGSSGTLRQGFIAQMKVHPNGSFLLSSGDPQRAGKTSVSIDLFESIHLGHSPSTISGSSLIYLSSTL